MKAMNIYLVLRDDECDYDYDEYDAFVVVAADEAAARSICNDRGWGWPRKDPPVVVTRIGTSDAEAGIVLGSFNAG